VGEEDKVVLPENIKETRFLETGKGANGSGNTEKASNVGPHWFEVMPRNKVQEKLIEISTK
jgi:hypothetical protein